MGRGHRRRGEFCDLIALEIWWWPLGALDLRKIRRLSPWRGSEKQLIEGGAALGVSLKGFLGEGTSWGLVFRKGTRPDLRV